MWAKILLKEWIRWKCVARQVGFVYLRFDPLCRSSQLNSLTTIDTRDASALGARGSEFNSRLRQGFYVWLFLLLLCFYFVCPNTHYLSQNFAISSAMLYYLVYLTYVLLPFSAAHCSQDQYSRGPYSGRCCWKWGGGGFRIFLCSEFVYRFHSIS